MAERYFGVVSAHQIVAAAFANLGGLVAIAGMERMEPDLLLGALLEVACRLPKLKPARLTELRQRGAAALGKRGTSKRAWSAREAALELHRVHLTSDQIRWLLHRLSAPVPGERAALPEALSGALQEVRSCDPYELRAPSRRQDSGHANARRAGRLRRLFLRCPPSPPC